MTNEQWARLQGQTVFDSAGQKIGDVQRVFYDPNSKQPSWITVRAGRFGSRESFVPLTGSRVGSGGLAVAVRKDVIHEAPAVDADSEMTVDDATRLNQYYEGQALNPPSTTPDATQAQRPPAPTGRSYPTETTEPSELTSYEEQLRVGTEMVDNGTVRLRKNVVTEPVETSVPLRHEEVSIERIPATEARVEPGHQFDEQVVEINLKSERPTIAKETVPVETVRMATKTETDERRISDQVRRERIEVEDQRSDKSTGVSNMGIRS